ncbi:MAG TPA: hypothetical protein PLF98_11440, partial [Thermotogota bacterium]|nr:hypothetical protein [Thermotogota bacterium]
GGMRRELRSRQGVPLGLFEVLCVIVSQWPDVSYLQCPHMITTSGDLYAKNGDGKFRYAEDSDNMVYIGGLHPILLMSGTRVDIAWSSKKWKRHYGDRKRMMDVAAIYGIPPFAS